MLKDLQKLRDDRLYEAFTRVGKESEYLGIADTEEKLRALGERAIQRAVEAGEKRIEVVLLRHTGKRRLVGTDVVAEVELLGVMTPT